MTITARIHNHSIALPADLDVLEGAEVQVTLPEPPASVTSAGPLDWMAEFVGALESLPADAAEQHTERAHVKRHLR